MGEVVAPGEGHQAPIACERVARLEMQLALGRANVGIGLLEDGQEQLVLAGEVVVDELLIDAGALGDRPDPRAAEAVPAELASPREDLLRVRSASRERISTASAGRKAMATIIHQTVNYTHPDDPDRSPQGRAPTARPRLPLPLRHDLILDTFPSRRACPDRSADRPGRDTVFGVPGESFLAALDGFYEHRERIRFIACRHEGGASYMAEAQGKLTGRPGLCLSPAARREQRGDRPAHRVPGLDADHRLHRPGGERAARSRGVPGSRYRQMFGPGTLGFAKWVAEVHQPTVCPNTSPAPSTSRRRDAPAPGARAARGHAAGHDRGAGGAAVEPALAAPAPEALASVRETPLPPRAVRHRRWQRLDAIRLRSPGSGFANPGSCRWAAPSVSRTFDNRRPNYAGDVGIGINPKLVAGIADADLVLAIGPRLGEMTTGGYELLIRRARRRS